MLEKPATTCTRHNIGFEKPLNGSTKKRIGTEAKCRGLFPKIFNLVNIKFPSAFQGRSFTIYEYKWSKQVK